MTGGNTERDKRISKVGFVPSISGFTIVETLIVLAVTGAIFLSAVALISGKQAKTEFQQGINEATSQIQQEIRDVSIGYYPDTTNSTCSASSGVPVVTASAPGVPNQQGQNSDCVFLGKVLQFGINGAGNEQFANLTIAGCQHSDCINANDQASLDTSGANPPYIHTRPQASSNLVSLVSLVNGLQLTSMTYTAPTAPHSPVSGQIRGMALMNSLANFSSCLGVCSGSSQVSLYVITNSAGDSTTDDMIRTINHGDRGVNIVPASCVEIDLQSGTTSQVGKIIIGGAGQLQATLYTNGGGSC